jgi:hypothetical protein
LTAAEAWASSKASAECPEVWLARRLEAGLPAEIWKPVPKIDGCLFSGYEARDTGCARSLARTGRNGRPLEAGPVSTRTNKNDDYIRLDMRCDSPDCKRPHTFTMQKVVLYTFDRPRPRGMQASHLHDHPEWNWWPENLAWEDQPANERRKVDRPQPPGPTHPCKGIQGPGCPNLVVNPGSRCRDCAAGIGRLIADMLHAGTPLPEAAAVFGYRNLAWALHLAQEFGGYTGTMAEAMASRPPLKGWRQKAARLLGVA